MIFLLETAAFLQLTLIPGLLIAGLIKPGFGKFRTLLLIPGLSLLVNYVFSAAALVSGNFTPAVSRCYFLATWLLTLWLYRREVKGFFCGNIRTPFQEYGAAVGENLREMYRERDLYGKVFLSAVLSGVFLGIWWFVDLWLDSWGKIFTTWDSALSWNYWATLWMEQKIPTNSSYYPQLIPLNWANAYLFIGRELQYAAKFSVMIFPLLAALFFADHGLRKRNVPMLISVPLLAYVLNNVDFLSHGAEVDLVIIYYSCAVMFMFFYIAETRHTAQFFRQLWLIILMISAAALTKQAGAFLIPGTAVFGGIILYKKVKELNIPVKKVFCAAVLMSVVSTALIAPAYIFANYRISRGMDTSNISFVTEDIYGGKSYLDRFVCSCRLFMLKWQAGQPYIAGARWAVLDKSGGWLTALFKLYYLHIPLGIVMLLFNIWVLYYNIRRERQYSGLLIVSALFFLIWSIFFCYDLRNLALAYPWIILLGAAALYGFFDNVGSRIKDMKTWQLMIVLALFAGIYMPDVFLSGYRQRCFTELKKEVGYPELNKMLYAWAENNDNGCCIVTDYVYGERLLPQINRRFSNCSFADMEEFTEKYNDPAARAIMIPGYAVLQIREFAAKECKKRKLRQLFVYREYTFYEKTGF